MEMKSKNNKFLDIMKESNIIDENKISRKTQLEILKFIKNKCHRIVKNYSNEP